VRGGKGGAPPGNEILRKRRRRRCGEKALRGRIAARFRNPLTCAGKGAKTSRKGGAAAIRILKDVVDNTTAEVFILL